MTHYGRARQAVHPTNPEDDMSTTTDPAELLNAREAAVYLRMSLPWVRLRTTDGTLPHARLGRRVVYRKTELDQFVREHSAPRPYRTRS